MQIFSAVELQQELCEEGRLRLGCRAAFVL